MNVVQTVEKSQVTHIQLKADIALGRSKSTKIQKTFWFDLNSNFARQLIPFPNPKGKAIAWKSRYCRHRVKLLHQCSNCWTSCSLAALPLFWHSVEWITLAKQLVPCLQWWMWCTKVCLWVESSSGESQFISICSALTLASNKQREIVKCKRPKLVWVVDYVLSSMGSSEYPCSLSKLECGGLVSSRRQVDGTENSGIMYENPGMGDLGISWGILEVAA